MTNSNDESHFAEVTAYSADNIPTGARQVLVCRSRACSKQGSADVLATFQANAISEAQVFGVHCMGQCGNGPMVRILPEDIWYWRVQPSEVNWIIKNHLIAGKPVKSMLYPVFHSRS